MSHSVTSETRSEMGLNLEFDCKQFKIVLQV